MNGPAPEADVAFAQTRPSASSLERAEACPISFSLPQVTKAGLFAENGTAIHAFIRARLINTPLLEALKAVPEELRDTCRGIDLEHLVGELATVRSEIAYAIDVKTRTAVELGENIHRRYEEAALRVLGRPLGRYEIPLTIDLEGRSRGGTEIAGDVKTGFVTVMGFAGLVPTAQHRQVQAEVTARALVTGADVVGGRIFKILENGEVKVDPHLFEPLELDTIGDELLEIQEGVWRARARFQEHDDLTMHPGPYCRHCPAASVCPARIGLLRGLFEQRGEIVGRLATLTDEQAWFAWVQVTEGTKLLDEVKGSLKSIVAQRFMMDRPITSPDGSQYVKPCITHRSDFNRTMALTLLRELGATEEQINTLWTPNTGEQYRICNTDKKPKKKKAKELPPATPALEAPAQAKLLEDKS